MAEKTKLGGQIFYENELRGSYLVVKLEGNTPLSIHQIEMLMNHPIESVLPFYHKERDGFHFLYYEITSKQPLNKVFVRKKMKQTEMIRILLQIIQTILNSSVYLLDYQHYLLDENFVYVDPNSLDVSLVYSPYAHEKREILKDLKALANHLMVALEPNEASKNNFLHGMMMAIHEEQSTLKDFQQLLMEMKNTVESPAQSEKVKLPEASNEGYVTNKKPTQPSTSTEMKAVDPKSLGTKSPLQHKGQREELKKKTSIFLLIQVLLMVATGLIYLETGLFRTEGGTVDGLSIFGWMGLLIAFDVFLFHKLLGSAIDPIALLKHGLKKHMQGQKKSSSNEKISGTQKKLHEKGFGLEPKKSPIQEPVVKNQSKEIDTPILKSNQRREEECATRFIEVGLHYPQLIGERNGTVECIVIDRPNFIIGKLEEQVDYVIKNQNISRIHAEVGVKEGQCYLRDLNSKNGTFLNGNRVQSNTDHSVQEGDLIRFANLEYRFTGGAASFD